MRRIILHQHTNPYTFDSILDIMLKKEDKIELLDSYTLSFIDEYSPDELHRIRLCNSALESKGYQPLTEEEIDFMLYPLKKPEDSYTLNEFNIKNR